MKLIKIKKIIKLKKKEKVYDILDIPDNHNFIANNVVVHNCDIFARGIGAVFVKDKNPSRESWRIKEFANIGNFNEFTPQAVVEKTLKKHPNFWMTIRFPKPSKKMYEKYLAIREKNVYDDDNVMSMITKEDIYKALLILALRDVMLHDASLNMNRIMLHIKNEYDIPLSKAVIESVVEDAKQLVMKVKEDNTRLE